MPWVRLNILQIVLYFLFWKMQFYLEEETATYCSILAREILWTEEPGGLRYMRLRKKSDVT